MKQLVLLLSLAAAMLVVAAPATANSVPTTGSQIRLFAPPTTFAANTPFFIEQGFIVPLGDGDGAAIEISSKSFFTLYVDGVLQPSHVDIDVVDGGVGAGLDIERRYLTNFPAGLPAGAHTFVGQSFLDGKLVDTRTVTITFS